MLEPGGDPVQPRVVGGVAGTPAGTALSLRLRGHEIRLKSLSLDAFRAVADLEYPVPAGFGAVVPAFPLRAVEVWGGGEFVAQYGFPGDTPDLALGSGELALRLAGGAFVADFSPHLGYDSYAADAAWQGVGFSGAVVRARVQARPERPEVGLFPVADSTRAFLYGRVGFLSLAPDGGLEGVAHTLPPSDVAAFFGEGADTRFLLQAPDGFALEIDGGEFQITGGGVGGLRLAGWAVLPERYASRPLRFERLTRRLVDGRPSGFVTEEIAADLPELRIEGFIYYPAAATLSIPAEAPLVVTAPEPLASAPAGWPAQPRDRARWTAGLQARVSARAAAGSGLLLIGGTLDLPWADGSLQPAAVTRLAEAEAGAVASPSSGARTDRFATAGATLPTLELQAARAQVAALEEARYEGGAFLLDDAGAIGAWLTLDEPHYKRVGEFSGRIAGAYLEFLASSLVDSRIGGALVIPYPAALEVGFEGSLDAAGEVLVSDLALGDGTGWALDYWKVRVVPGTGRQQPRFRGDRIEIPGAALWLEVDAAYGGSEFQTSDGRAPFAVRLDLLPDGNVGEVALSVAENPLGPGQIPVGGGPRMLFLGLEFTPEALDGADSPFAFRRYYGQGPPAPEAEPSDEWLVRVTGRIAFGLFGERKVRVHHTARGAQVPFVENVESGVRDSTGVLELFTSRVRFLNTFARDERGLAARVEQYQTQ
ncbi:MAG TPA: hypothetical protein VK997_00820, partial [Deferrisomatales bacterium]|nr:hypothetical protein [Deferrisomatales bacterium]